MKPDPLVLLFRNCRNRADDAKDCDGQRAKALHHLGELVETPRELLGGLGLELSAEKTWIVDCRSGAEGFDFLGDHFRMQLSRRGRPFAACWPSRAAMVAARDRIRHLTPLAKIRCPAIVVVQDINRFLRGWGGYFRYGNSTQQFRQLDAFVFERVAHFIARKHKSRTWRRGMVDLIESRTKLGIYRLAGTVRYASVQAPQ